MPEATRTSPLLSPELLLQLERLELVSRKIFRGRLKGERRSRRKGQSVEFADFRNYVPGDDLRFIDWNLYARLDKLFLKLFLEEEDLHFYALIDTSNSMDFGDPTKLHYAKQLAAALGFIGLCRADRVKIETLGQTAGPSPVLRGRHSLWRMTDYLETLGPSGDTSLEAGVQNFCLRNPGKGIVVLLTDLMDKHGYEAALRYLLARDLDVYVIHILSAGRTRSGNHGRSETGRLRRRRRGRDHGQPPFAGSIPENTLGLYRWGPGILQPTRDDLPAGQSTDPGRSPGQHLPASARVGAMIDLFDSLRSFLNDTYRTLAVWQWLVLAAIPPLIVLLYFLKLRRQPLEVPSTYLWHRTLEDLHVNSLWQRLRQNLLLFLQLLLLLLAILACLRPSWLGSKLTGERYIFLVDTSASMSATDVEPTRLEAAKAQLIDLIDQQLKPGSVAMVISFSDRAIVEQPFTDNRGLLKRRVQAIQPTQHGSQLEEALRVAAGLANPGRTGTEATDVAAADALPAELLIFSDGRFRSAPQFAMGQLKPKFVPMGLPKAENVGILAFSTAQTPDRPDQIQVFGQLQNFGDQDAEVTANLYLEQPGSDSQLLDAAAVPIPAGGEGGVEFVLDSVPSGVLQLEFEEADDLAIDNRAFANINPQRRSKVLLVTPRNDALETVFQTPFAQRLADVEQSGPELLTTPAYQQMASAGAYDLVIYDQCSPPELPRCNTYFIGTLPPDDRWTHGPVEDLPQIIDTDRAHPLMRFVELGDLKWIVTARPLNLPTGGTVLIDSHRGVLLGIAPREGFEDLVQGFEIVGENSEGERYANTDWPIRTSFPLFIGNVLTYLGGAHPEATKEITQPGQPITLRTAAPVDSIEIEDPLGNRTRLQRGPQNSFVFGNTSTVGIYTVREGDAADIMQQFAVNLFDPVESHIRPTESVETHYENIAATALEPTRREAWKILLMGALGVLILEWYIYNRRVYV